jgi:hypothetical protein
MMESLPVLGQFSQVYVGNSGSDAGSAGKTLMEFGSIKERPAGADWEPGQVGRGIPAHPRDRRPSSVDVHFNN